MCISYQKIEILYTEGGLPGWNGDPFWEVRGEYLARLWWWTISGENGGMEGEIWRLFFAGTVYIPGLFV